MSQSGDAVIRDLRPEDIEAAVDVLALSFLEFPVLQVMAGTGPEARHRMARVFAMEFEPEARMTAMVAELDDRVVGVLTYTDSPNCSHMSAGRMERFMRIAGPRLFHAMRMFGSIERSHPRTAHRHLPSIGVEPSRQRQGIGRALMEVFDRRCDTDGIEAYLETIRWADPTKHSRERFYERLGYETQMVIPMTEEWSVLSMRRLTIGARV